MDCLSCSLFDARRIEIQTFFNKLKMISDKSFSHKFLPINGNSNYSRMMFPYFDTVDNLNSHSIVWVRVPLYREIWNCIPDRHISHGQFYSNEFSITVYDYTGAFEFYVLFSVFCFLCFVRSISVSVCFLFSVVCCLFIVVWNTDMLIVVQTPNCSGLNAECCKWLL